MGCASLGAAQFFASGPASAYGPAGGSTTTAPATTTTTAPGSTTTTTAPGSTTTTTTASCSIGISLSGNLVAGGNITVSITGAPDSSYLATLHSPGSVLGTIDTNAGGSGAATFPLPSSLSPGMKTVVVQGQCGTNSMEFTLDPGIAAGSSGAQGAGGLPGGAGGNGGVPGGAGGSGGIPGVGAGGGGALNVASGSSGSLAFTGAQIALFAALAAAAICLGGMLVLAARRRRGVAHLRPVS